MSFYFNFCTFITFTLYSHWSMQGKSSAVSLRNFSSTPTFSYLYVSFSSSFSSCPLPSLDPQCVLGEPSFSPDCPIVAFWWKHKFNIRRKLLYRIQFRNLDIFYLSYIRWNSLFPLKMSQNSVLISFREEPNKIISKKQIKIRKVT